ncbi:MAG: hypothetical protein HYU71_10510 [Bacteroidetes bacterium]|nr:hypothetical protein [Bacteroidota bacterium]
MAFRRVFVSISSLLLLVTFSFSQQTDSTKTAAHFSGSVLVTNNGISLIPTFSLGKPATIINLSMGRGRLSFEPELRFSLEARPWSFLFWWRYKLLQGKRFTVNLGMHPALNFRTSTLLVNGIKTENTVARRYLAAELNPGYQLTRQIRVGAYYLYSRGLDEGTTRVTHFVTVNTSFSNIPLPAKLQLRFTPQLYYLQTDAEGGYFISSAFQLNRKDWPVSLGALLNKRLQSNITGSKDLVWNLSLSYAFAKKYLQQ